MDCLFCKIVNKQLAADIVHEDTEIVAFKDIHPKAPLHLLVVPKKHIESVNHLKQEDCVLAGKLLLAAQTLARAQGLIDKGYKIVFNVGRGGGQVIDHLHLHLLSG